MHYRQAETKARRLAREKRAPMAVVEYDHNEGRRVGVWPESDTWGDEFFAFDGRLLAIVQPSGDVDRW